jgi:hypothetical protein
MGWMSKTFERVQDCCLGDRNWGRDLFIINAIHHPVTGKQYPYPTPAPNASPNPESTATLAIMAKKEQPAHETFKKTPDCEAFA